MLAVIGVVAAFIVAVLVLNRWHDFGVAMMAGSFILALTGGFTLSQVGEVFWHSISAKSTMELVAVVVLISLLGFILKQTGSLESLVHAMLQVLRDVRLLVLAIPAVIGLLAVPGGAVMSAPLVAETGRKAGLSPERQAAANILFRHLLFLVFPLYPTLILAEDLSGITVASFAAHQVIPLLTGIIVSFLVLFRSSDVKQDAVEKKEKWLSALQKLFFYASPILSIIILIVGFKLNYVTSVGIGVMLSLVLGVKNSSQLADRIKKYLLPGLDWKLAIAVFGIMLFRGFTEASGVMTELAQVLEQAGVPILLLAVVLAAFTGMATGASLAAVGILFPIFIPLLPPGMDNLSFLSVIFISSMVGYISSPVHMCLVLTKEVCQARFGGMYPYLLPPLTAMLVASVVQALI